MCFLVIFLVLRKTTFSQRNVSGLLFWPLGCKGTLFFACLRTDVFLYMCSPGGRYWIGLDCFRFATQLFVFRRAPWIRICTRYCVIDSTIDLWLISFRSKSTRGTCWVKFEIVLLSNPVSIFFASRCFQGVPCVVFVIVYATCAFFMSLLLDWCWDCLF